jgi:16S rRNA (uracil1498-N3)-methyltransferase
MGMKRYHIRHKVQPGDIVHLSDSDSELIISQKWHDEEDFVEIHAEDKIFLGQITFIDKASVEVEIQSFVRRAEEEVASPRDLSKPRLILIQSLTNDSKFTFLLEKAVEIGVDQIIPVESEYSLLDVNKAQKHVGLWRKVIHDAVEQSRNPLPTFFDRPILLEEIKRPTNPQFMQICLATEAIEAKPFAQVIKPNTSLIIAIGPEKGWSSKDLNIFREKGFEFASLGKNILRTETPGLVIGSIFNFINGIY